MAFGLVKLFIIIILKKLKVHLIILFSRLTYKFNITHAIKHKNLGIVW